MPSNINISYLPHNVINKKKWDDTIEKACNSLLYAKAVYLDYMSPGWDAIILGDYEAVFPVTWRRKWGVKYVCQPAFCQQLGLFYKNPAHARFSSLFQQEITSRFVLAEIFLNYQNSDAIYHLVHNNFLFLLNKKYDELYLQYAPGFTKSLRRIKKFNFIYSDDASADEVIDLYKKNYGSKINVRNKDYEAFKKLTACLLQNRQAFVRKVTLPDNTLLAISLFLKDDHRIYNMISVTLPEGRRLEANYFLYDRLVYEFAYSKRVLDLEGSDLPGVAAFYQKFSPVNEPYFFWKNNRLPYPIKWFKQ